MDEHEQHTWAFAFPGGFIGLICLAGLFLVGYGVTRWVFFC